MSDTPRTDAVQGGLEFATELPEDWEKCFQWMAGHARSLERENAELSDQLMRWFKAASPYATPGSLEEGLKDVERFRILSEYVAAIIWKKDSDLPPLGHLKNGFSIDDLRAWCDGAKK
jgi:hypothetical protein